MPLLAAGPGALPPRRRCRCCRCRCRCRARPGRSPRASAAVAGVWAGCDAACCRTPRAGGGRLTVLHCGRAPCYAPCYAQGGSLLPCLQEFGVCPWCRQVALVVPSCAVQLGAACATQGLCKLLGTAVAFHAVPHRAMQLVWTPGHCSLCMFSPGASTFPVLFRGIFPIGKSLCSLLDPSLVCQPPAAVCSLAVQSPSSCPHGTRAVWVNWCWLGPAPVNPSQGNSVPFSLAGRLLGRANTESAPHRQPGAW